MTTPPITDNTVYVAGHLMRRIIRVLRGKVFYSGGSDRNRTCLVRTFERWAKRAEIVHKGESQ